MESESNEGIVSGTLAKLQLIEWLNGTHSSFSFQTIRVEVSIFKPSELILWLNDAMFNPLQKNGNYKVISAYPTSWSILEEKNEGLIIRVNAGYKEAAGHPDYPIKMGVAVPVKGEHDEATTNLKYQIEDTLDELFQNNTGVLVAIVTSMKGVKFIEFLSYAKNDLDFGSIHKTLKNKFPNEDVQMYAEGDSEWTAYKSFLK